MEHLERKNATIQLDDETVQTLLVLPQLTFKCCDLRFNLFMCPVLVRCLNHGRNERRFSRQ